MMTIITNTVTSSKFSHRNENNKPSHLKQVRTDKRRHIHTHINLKAYRHRCVFDVLIFVLSLTKEPASAPYEYFYEYNIYVRYKIDC